MDDLPCLMSFTTGQGSAYTYGDSFYEKKFYNRLDLIIHAFCSQRAKRAVYFQRAPHAGFHQQPGSFQANL